MSADLPFGEATLLSFLLALSRIAGLFVFVPIPGLRTGPDAARLLASLALTVALFPFWPTPASPDPPVGELAAWVLAEFAVGATAGVVVALVLEGFQMAGQLIGLQAGYGYAATIDPTTQADAGVLLIFSQLLAGCLFFALGVDRALVKVLALSLQSLPATSFRIQAPAVEGMIRLGAEVFSLGLRIAMPEIALLALIDLCFGVLGRLLPQIQFLALSFPLKMAAALLALAATLAVFPETGAAVAGHGVVFLREVLRPR